MKRFIAILLVAILGIVSGGALAWALTLPKSQAIQTIISEPENVASTGKAPDQNIDQAIKACDELASHPEDPLRVASGVSDRQLAIGAAIKACGAAVDSLTEESPDYARISFQHGRALWLEGQDYDKAFLNFINSAYFDYPAAMKYVGDAFLEGKGLPSGEEQSTYTALEWYKQSAKAGFSVAEQAIQEVEKLLKDNVFDKTIFKNQEYATRLYEADFNNIDNPVLFIQYAKGMFKMLDSDQAMDHAPECKPLLSKLGALKLKIGEVTSYIDMLTNPNANAEQILGDFLTAAIGGTFLNDDGQRDAVTMINHLGCDSPVAMQIVAGMEKIEPMVMQQVGKLMGKIK